VKVDIRVAEGTTGDSITADTDRCNGTEGAENVKQEALVHIGSKVANVKRRRTAYNRTFTGGSSGGGRSFRSSGFRLGSGIGGDRGRGRSHGFKLTIYL
jgi:hypothetical protein